MSLLEQITQFGQFRWRLVPAVSFPGYRCDRPTGLLQD